MDPITAAMALAQFVPNIVTWITGNKEAGEVAEKVVNVAKQITGKDTPEEAIESLKANPDLILAYRKAVLEQETEITKIAAEVISEVNETMRIEAGSAHWPSYSWRPYIGFSFGTYVNSLWLLPLLGKAPVIMSPDLVIAIGGILGVASWFRGQMQLQTQNPTAKKG